MFDKAVFLLAALSVAACNTGGDDLLPAPQTGERVPSSPSGSAPGSEPGTETAALAPAESGAGELAPAEPRGDEAPGVAGSGGGLEWVAPAEWRSQELASAMRIANWDAGPEGVEMSCALFAMPGGGSVDDNVRRWVGQFEVVGGGPPEDAEQAAIEVAGRSVTLVRTAGTFLDRGASMQSEAVRHENYGLFGAIVPMAEGTGFLKCTGPEITVQSQEGNALAFVRTLRVTGP